MSYNSHQFSHSCFAGEILRLDALEYAAQVPLEIGWHSPIPSAAVCEVETINEPLQSYQLGLNEQMYTDKEITLVTRGTVYSNDYACTFAQAPLESGGSWVTLLSLLSPSPNSLLSRIFSAFSSFFC